MEMLRQLWGEIQGILDDMTHTQKGSVIVLFAIVAALLIFSYNIGSQSEGTALVFLPIQVDVKKANEMMNALENAGLGPVEYHDDGIYIGREKISRATAFLAEKDLLPDDSSGPFMKMLKQLNFTDTKVATQQKIRVALQTEMRQMISSMDAIDKATVIYSDTTRASVFAPQQKKRAAVRVEMAFGKKLTQGLANTITALVASAKAGLDASDVTVTDQRGTQFRMEDENAFSTIFGRAQSQVQRRNEILRKKITRLLKAAVPNSDQTVVVEYIMKTDQIDDHLNEILAGPALKVTKSKTDMNSSKQPGGPVGTNTDVNRLATVEGGSAGAKEISTTLTKKSTVLNKPGSRQTNTIFAPKVEGLGISVIIELPQFVYDINPATGEYIPEKEGKGDKKTPKKDANGNPVYKRKQFVWDAAKEKKIKDIILAAAGKYPGRDDNIKVELYAIPYTADLTQPEAKPSMLTFIEEFLMEKGTVLIVSFLLIMSLFFVRAQGKKALRAEDMELPPEMPKLTKNAIGMTDEISDQDREFEVIREQVGDVIAEDPRGAANIVRRWMHRENF